VKHVTAAAFVAAACFTVIIIIIAWALAALIAH